MPLSAELRRTLYNTPAWKAQRERVLSRAVDEKGRARCECTGECGKRHGSSRCLERDGELACGDGLKRGARTIITCQHVDHDTGRPVPDTKLRAYCQGCALRYDEDQHQASRRRNRRGALEAAGQMSLTLTKGTSDARTQNDPPRPPAPGNARVLRRRER